MPADWRFMPPYNPLEYEPLPPAPRPLRRRVLAEMKRIALEAALRTALLAVGLLILHWLLVARGFRLDM